MLGITLLAVIAAARDTVQEVSLIAPPWAAGWGADDAPETSTSNCDPVVAELQKTRKELAESRELQREAEEADEFRSWEAGRRLRIFAVALCMAVVSLGTVLGYLMLPKTREVSSLREPLTGSAETSRVCLGRVLRRSLWPCMWLKRSCSEGCSSCCNRYQRASDPEAPTQHSKSPDQKQAHDSRRALRDAQTSMEETSQKMAEAEKGRQEAEKKAQAAENVSAGLRCTVKELHEKCQKMAEAEKAQWAAEKKVQAAETAAAGFKCALKELREKCHQEVKDLREKCGREMKEADRRVELAEGKARKLLQELEVMKASWKVAQEMSDKSRQELQHARMKAEIAEEIVTRSQFDMLFPEEPAAEVQDSSRTAASLAAGRYYPHAPGTRRSASLSKTSSRTSLISDTGRAPRVDGRVRASSLSRSSSKSSLNSISGGMAFDKVYRKAARQLRHEKIEIAKRSDVTARAYTSRHASRSVSTDRALKRPPDKRQDSDKLLPVQARRDASPPEMGA